jgi:hypothetical protein
LRNVTHLRIPNLSDTRADLGSSARTAILH